MGSSHYCSTSVDMCGQNAYSVSAENKQYGFFLYYYYCSIVLAEETLRGVIFFYGMKLKIELFFHFFALICNKLWAASHLTPSSLQWSFILCIASSPHCLWFQELNYSATFVDVVLQVNAAELCSSWNCSSSLIIGRGTHHHRLYTAKTHWVPLNLTLVLQHSNCPKIFN